MSKLLCKFPDCVNYSNAQKERNYCKTHLAQQKHGGVLTPLRRSGLSLEERFWTKVDKSAGDEGCWIWTAARYGTGYGAFWLGKGKGNTHAHRFSYSVTLGGVTASVQVDHIDCVRECVNPAHLRLVDNKENSENRTVLNKNNSSGYRGVFYDKTHGYWIATVTHNRNVHRKAGFRSVEDANEWAIAKRLELFTHNDQDRQ